jgi:hypothetical protein
LGPESCFAATPAGLAGIAHTAGSADVVAAEVASILSSQGQNFHHLPDVSAGLLLDAAPWTRHLVVADAELVPDTGEGYYSGHHQPSVLLARPDRIRPLKGLLLLTSFRQKMVKSGLLLTQCFAG